MLMLRSAFFYWFEMVYTPLIRWEGLPEEAVAALAELAAQTKWPGLTARAVSIYQTWCTVKTLSRPKAIRQKGRDLALQAYGLWRSIGRLDRADDEISFAQYRLANRYSRRTAARFARRRSHTTPQAEPAQLAHLKKNRKGVYWWLMATEEQRVGWLSWMLPRYLEVDNLPKHPAKKNHPSLSILSSASRAYRWVEDILNIGMLGAEGRRPPVDKQPPTGHLLTGPEWRVLSGQRTWPLLTQAAREVANRYLAELESELG